MQTSKFVKLISALTFLGVLLLAAAVLIGCGSSSSGVTRLLFVADSGNYRVLVYNAPFTTGETASVALGQPGLTTGSQPLNVTATTINLPQAVAVDIAGNLYVADAGNCRVLQFKPPFATGMAATLAVGQASGATNLTTNTCNATAAGLDGPEGIAFDSSGNVWVADGGNDRVLMYPAPITAGEAATVALGQTSTSASTGCNQGLPGTAPTASTLCVPTQLAFDSTGNLWVVDESNGRVVMYPKANLVTGGAATVALGQASLNSPRVFATTQNGMYTPFGIAFDSSGNLWVSDLANNRITQFTPPFATDMNASLVLGQATFTTSAAATTQSGLSLPLGIAFDSNGNLGVAEETNDRTLVFTPPFTNGMNASLVLGQANFTTATFATTAAGQGDPHDVTF